MCVNIQMLRLSTEKKLLPTDNLITLTLGKQVSELIWELWFYFCQCLISCHADALHVKGFMWLSGKMTNKVRLVWCSSSLFSWLITFGFWALSGSPLCKQATFISLDIWSVRDHIVRGDVQDKSYSLDLGGHFIILGWKWFSWLV